MASHSSINRKRALAIGGTVAGGLFAAAAGLADSRAAEAADQSGGALVLNGATIVNTHDGTLQHGMAVVVKHGKISAIVPAASISVDRSATTIDARGTYLVPGFNDLHAHALGSSDPEGSLTLLLANGITGFREMGAWNTMLEQRRQGTLLPIGAPELLELAGEILSPGNARTPDQAVATIQSQLKRGADFIKIIDYSPAVFAAVAAECKRTHTRFMGHLLPTIDVRAAVTAGMTSMEHMGPRDAILLGCSTKETALRPAFAPPPPPTGVSPAGLPPGPVPPDVIARSVANPTLATTTADIVRYQNVIDTYSETRMHELAAHFAAAGTWQVPTLIRVRTMGIGDDARYRNDPDLQYVPTRTKQMWEDVSQQFAAKFSPESRATLKRLYEASAQMVKPFKTAGANMMAGSDLGGGFVVPGFGLHREFDLLEEAGLSPLDVLQMTTLNGAKFLGREATMGTVAVGKDANLVLLDANPMASVQNLHRIAGVMRAGTYYSAAALAQLKKRTADRVAAGVAYTEPLQPPCC